MTRLPAATFGSRKEQPLARGLLDYFPAALAAVAEVSMQGADQHGTMAPDGTPTHQRGLSDDHPDALLRHLVDRGSSDHDGLRHSAKVAWRALAILQEEIEAEDATLEKARAAELNEGLMRNKDDPEPGLFTPQFTWGAGDHIQREGPAVGALYLYTINGEEAALMNKLGGDPNNWNFERLEHAKFMDGKQWTPEQQADIERVAKSLTPMKDRLFSPKQPVENDI